MIPNDRYIKADDPLTPIIEILQGDYQKMCIRLRKQRDRMRALKLRREYEKVNNSNHSNHIDDPIHQPCTGEANR